MSARARRRKTAAALGGALLAGLGLVLAARQASGATVIRTTFAGLNPLAVAIDQRTGHALVVNGGGTVRVSDRWA